MNLHDLLQALRPVLSAFDRLGIVYYIGGSVASSIYGEPRPTLDIDIGADVPDTAYLEEWSERLQVQDLWDRIRRETGFHAKP